MRADKNRIHWYKIQGLHALVANESNMTLHGNEKETPREIMEEATAASRDKTA